MRRSLLELSVGIALFVFSGGIRTAKAAVTCNTDNECGPETPHCVDHYCCDTVCGLCGACNGADRRKAGESGWDAAENGKCAMAPPLFPGCTGNTRCNGASLECPRDCSDDRLCVDGFYCDKRTSKCVPASELGESCPCEAPRDSTTSWSCSHCAGGYCADGVCCNALCSGDCQACTHALKGDGQTGICGPVIAGGVGRGICEAAARAHCATTGRCGADGNCEPVQGANADLLACLHPGAAIDAGCDAGLPTRLTGALDADRCEPQDGSVVQDAGPFDAHEDAPHDALFCDNEICREDGNRAAICSQDTCSDAANCPSGSCSDVVGCTGERCPLPHIAGCGGDDCISIATEAGDSNDASILNACGPYLMRGGHCLDRCESVRDCTVGNVCHREDHHCGPLAKLDAPNASCAVGLMQERETQGVGMAVLGTALLVGAARLRRRSRQMVGMPII